MPKKDQQGYYGFDPSGLERAAAVIQCFYVNMLQAAKYLDQSSNSKQAFDLALKKEETKQIETVKRQEEIKENAKYAQNLSDLLQKA